VDCVGDKGYEGGARGDVRRGIYVAVENVVVSIHRDIERVDREGGRSV